MPPTGKILSFRTRLIRLAVLTSGLAVLLTLLATVAAKIVEMRREIENRMQSHAEVLASNSTAVLLFEDADAARSTLRAVQFVEGIEECHLYGKDGRSLASFVRGGEKLAQAPPIPPVSRWFDGLTFHLAHPVVFDGDEVGLLYLRYHLRADAWRLAGSMLLILLLGGLALGVAYLLASRLQQAISRPISELERAVARVADRRDYTVRARKFSDDELGKLTDGVNEMLRQIELRDWALEEHRSYLEKRVNERTTELSSANEALQVVNEELIKSMEESQRLAKLAEAASRAKSSFLANMSHEIRTPATAIVGYIDLMRRRRVIDPAQSRDWLERIRHNADHLVMLVNDLLDISKIEAGQMQANVRPCSLQGVLRQIESVMNPFAERKGVDFSIRLEGPVPPVIHTDQVRLKQILLNLVNNAIKFTEEGGSVKMAVQAGPDVSGDRRRLLVTVADNGIGIDPEKLPEIFQPFTQVFDPSQRNYGGAGLGLNISQKLAHLLGGRIRVTSEKGVGTTFTLTTDVGAVEDIALVDPSELQEEAATEEVRSDEAADLSAYRVLVADDNDDNQQIIRFFLSETGVELRMVGDGQAAVTAFEEAAAAGRPFDLVLMDMQMPVLDGYGATGRLRQLGHRVPIIALTAFALAEDRQRCMDAGCDDHVPKPIDPALLLETIQTHLRAAPRRPGGPEILSRELECLLEGRHLGNPDVPDSSEVLSGHLETIRRVAQEQGYQEIVRSAAHCLEVLGRAPGSQEIEQAMNELIGIPVAAAPRSN